MTNLEVFAKIRPFDVVFEGGLDGWDEMERCCSMHGIIFLAYGSQVQETTAKIELYRFFAQVLDISNEICAKSGQDTVSFP